MLFVSLLQESHYEKSQDSTENSGKICNNHFKFCTVKFHPRIVEFSEKSAAQPCVNPDPAVAALQPA
jgi:hypothetical protein